MKSDFERVYHQLEKNHFWFKGRRQHILQQLREADRDYKILDIGCSSGILLDDLVDAGFKQTNLYGIDISETAIENCHKAGFTNTFVMDAQNITLPQKFDIIIASDCLEHLPEDEKALSNWKDLLKPDGVMYVYVPALMRLWSEHDVVNMHIRRYEKGELNIKIRNCGFEIQKSGFWNFFLFMPTLLVRLFSRINTSSKNTTGDLNKISIFNNVLFKVLSFENKMNSYFSFPIGVSSFCVAKKASVN